MFLGIDTGGTFTDFVYYDGKRMRVHKVLSTPQAPEKAILQGIKDLALDLQNLNIIHGSTVATNAVLEEKGVATVLITNRGLKDMLTIGRQVRTELYQLQPQSRPAPVPQAFCLETGGRLAADGSVVEPLTEQDIRLLCEQVQQLKPRAVAINLLFSFLDDQFEQTVERALGQSLFISRSSSVLPVYKEYERGIATWLNAWVGPLVAGYLQSLTDAVKPARVTVMQSSGGTLAAADAGGLAVNLLLSGPAGGLAGAKYIGEGVGRKSLMSFDMGGTSTDVALIDGEIKLTDEGMISRYPVAVPMVDMHTVGAGGGSIASIDAGGLLQVGPESAGANPGPACYGNGGEQPTVTDANVVLGRIPLQTRLAGSIPIQHRLACQAVASLAQRLSVDCEQAALGIIRVANEHMAQALKLISIQRGYDPRQFTLVSFGGAGGLHVCELADNLNMNQAMIPQHCGVLSALGMLVAKPVRQLSKTFKGLLQEIDTEQINKQFERLEHQGRKALQAEGVTETDINTTLTVDLRYQGQSHCLNVLWENRTQAESSFIQLHVNRYGHRLALAVELVNLRIRVAGTGQQLQWETTKEMDSGPQAKVDLFGEDVKVPLWRRDQLLGKDISGPVLVADNHATSYIARDWRCQADSKGNLLLQRCS